MPSPGICLAKAFLKMAYRLGSFHHQHNLNYFLIAAAVPHHGRMPIITIAWPSTNPIQLLSPETRDLNKPSVNLNELAINLIFWNRAAIWPYLLAPLSITTTARRSGTLTSSRVPQYPQDQNLTLRCDQSSPHGPMSTT